MITKPEHWRRIDTQLRAAQRLSYAEARRIFNALYKEARHLGQITAGKGSLRGLEAKVRLAKALNSLASS